jgi:Fe2+ transport system protein B
MKKFLIIVLTLAVFCPRTQAHDTGGAVAAGAIGGLVLGTMMHAAASESNRKTRIEEQVAQVQHDQERQVDNLKRKISKQDLETRLIEQQRRFEQQRIVENQRALELQREKDRTNTLLIILLSLIGLLFFIIIGLGIYIFSRKHPKE